MLQKLFYNFFIAVDAISKNRMRAFLTSLGIIFGVASVISMLAIGKGAEREILEQLKILGTNNIIIEPVIEQEEGKVEEELTRAREKKRFSPGLTLFDALGIESYIPHVNLVSPEIVDETLLIRAGLKRSVKLVGVKSAYFESSVLELGEGELFTEYHEEHAVPVGIIGYGIKTKFFPQSNPLGKKIKCGNLWLTVVGVLKERPISKKNIQKLGIRDYNMDVYAPITTVLIRHKNRARVTREDILKYSRQQDEENNAPQTTNYHQVDRIVVQMDKTRYMTAAADIIHRMLKRRHNEVVDFEVIIPRLLLSQEQQTKRIFNIVLGAIASISLIVGGIGITNIMLASVMERIREIGIRQAVGATQKDIVLQFLAEAVTISLTGGFFGIFLGFFISYGIQQSTGILTIVTPLSVVLSFMVSISIGLVFGIVPARKAAKQDPIVSLRYE